MAAPSPYSVRLAMPCHKANVAMQYCVNDTCIARLKGSSDAALGCIS